VRAAHPSLNIRSDARTRRRPHSIAWANPAGLAHFKTAKMTSVGRPRRAAPLALRLPNTRSSAHLLERELPFVTVRGR